MRFRWSFALVASLLVALTATAQEQRGSIEGILRDASGGVLPGAMVEAKSAKVGGVYTAYTDAEGEFRFPALPPSDYSITGSLAGFTPARVENVELKLGQVLRVDLTLQLEGIAEEITVTSEAPLIDVKRSAATHSIRDELIEKLPRGRDFTSVVAQSASANNESALGGISIDGASGSENRFIIDGIDTTEIQTGTSGKALITDFIDEVQVKSSGYEAQYGGATGGVINVITKSGGNEWAGTLAGYVSSSKFYGARRPTLRLNQVDDTIAEYVTFDKDSFEAGDVESYDTWQRIEPGGTVGGPLFTDRMWMFAGYNPSFTSTRRTWTYLGDGETYYNTTGDQSHYFTANATGQLSSKMRGRIGASISNRYLDNILPNSGGSSSPSSNFDIDTKLPDTTISGNLDYTATNNLYFGVRGGYYQYDDQDTGIPAEVWLQCVGSNTSFNPPPGQGCINSQRNIQTNSASGEDFFSRLSFTFDGTVFAEAGGDHAIKGGLQFDRIKNRVLSGYQEPRHLFYWGREVTVLVGNEHTPYQPGERVSGDYGWLRVLQIATQGDVNSSQVGFFIQDSWTVNDRLTLNLGLRTETEAVPSFRTDLGQAENAIEFKWADKFAPRIGFALDVMGDGRWKAYGSWGQFYDIFKLEMPRGLFGGDQWLDYRYKLDRLDWLNVDGAGQNCHTGDLESKPECHGLEFIEVVDFRHPSNDPNDPTIDPDLEPMKSSEYTVGVQHELNPTMSLGFRYVHKQLDQVIEDVGTLVEGVGEVYWIANPGERVAEFTIGEEFPAQPRPKRDYDGFEFEFTKRMANNWSLHASYLYSKLDGNYSGLASSDEGGRTSPNVNRFFDSIVMSFDENGNPVYGPLGTDRPHQFKLQGLYDFEFGSSIGLNMYMSSGTPVSRQVDIQSTTPVFYQGRLTDGRTPTYSQFDLYYQHLFRLGDGSSIELSVNVDNLFDSDTATGIWADETRDVMGLSNEEFFAGFNTQQEIESQGLRRDPRFLLDSGFQSRRAVRFGMKYIW